jgi:hypothetical protein
MNEVDDTDPAGLEFVTTRSICFLFSAIIYFVYFLSLCRYVWNGFCLVGMGTVATAEAQELQVSALLMCS